MKTIIKKGSLKVLKCCHCGCEFSYEEEDIEKVSEVNKIGGAEKEIVKCPQCNGELVLLWKGIK